MQSLIEQMKRIPTDNTKKPYVITKIKSEGSISPD